MRISVLGPLLVTDSSGGRARIGSAKQRTLLAHLVCLRPAPVSVDAILDVLWGDSPPASARQNVHLYVHRLRRVLGEDVITNSGYGYQLADRDDLVDVDAFERHAEHGRAAWARGDADTARREFGSALVMWRGEPYTGVEPTSRVAEDAARLEETYLAIAERRNDAELAVGRHAELVPELMTLAERHPLRERFTAQLMTALYRSGRAGDALDAYRTTYRTLADELGLEPTAELRDLERAVLTDDPRLLNPAEAVTARRMVGGANDRDQTVAYSAGRPSGSVPAQLPRDLADFTGRDEHVTLLCDQLAESGPTVLAIAGLGGVGKTSLALHVAHLKVDDYPDGQLYADLRGTSAEPLESRQVLHWFLRALGVSDQAVPASTAERATLYRSLVAQRRMIVVLDNAASEQQVRPLLPGSRACGVLVTSRRALEGLEGAKHVHLDVFQPKEAESLLERIVGTAAVNHEPQAASEIAELCGHVPLAIRIAGARLARRRHWSLAEMARMLGDERRRLDELSAGDLEVRSSISLTYRALPDATRRAFRLLGSLRVSSFPAWVAAAALDVAPREALAHVETLVDVHLLSVSYPNPTQQPRYRMPNLVAIYANERSIKDDATADHAAAFKRAAGAWLYVAELAADKTPGPCYVFLHGTAPRWKLPESEIGTILARPLDWFDAEADAIMDVVFRACALGDDELAWDLAVCLERYFDIRARSVDWRRTYHAALEACERAGNLLGEAVLRRGLAELNAWATPDDSTVAMRDLHGQARQILDLFEKIDQPRGKADALVLMTWSLISQGDTTWAVATARESLALATELEYLGGRARAHHVLSVAEHFSGRTEEARHHLLVALDMARQLGSVRFEITAMQFLGAAEEALGMLDEAHERLSLSLAMAREIPDPYAEVFSLLYLGRLYAGPPHVPRQRHEEFATSDRARARVLVQQALALGRKHGFSHHTADALTILAELELRSGNPALAIDLLDEAIAIWRTRGWDSFLANAQELLAQARKESLTSS